MSSKRTLIKAPKVGTGYQVRIYDGRGNVYLYFPTLKEARAYARKLKPEITSAAILKPIEYVR